MFILASKNTPFATILFNKIQAYYADSVSSWTWIQTKKDLSNTLNSTNTKDIQKVFFFHWSFIVPEHIFNNYECIVIHTANLPNGRGGSPIQNQIIDGVVHSHVNALRMTGVLDGGDIYCKKPITLQGNLNDIWYIIAITSFELITNIIDSDLKCCPQAEPTTQTYKRRKDNHIPFENNENNIEDIYNFIRMLDGNNYPKSYINIGNYKLEFSRASQHFNNNTDKAKILCDVEISQIDSDD